MQLKTERLYIFFPLVALLCFFFIGISSEAAQSEATLVSMFPQTDLYAWYTDTSGYHPPISTVFGAYVSQAIDTTLYLGLASGRPAQLDGAYLASTDGTLLTPINKLEEQGVHEFMWFSNTLHIAGTDPCCGDGQETGNHYTFQPPNSFIKHRSTITGLVNVVHTWSLFSESSNKLYATTGSVVAGSTVGQIHESFDNGNSWKLVGDIGQFRIYDLEKVNETYVALVQFVNGQPLSLYMSRDSMSSWTQILNPVLDRGHLTTYHDKLLATGLDQATFYIYDGDSTITSTLPITYRISRLPESSLPNFSITSVVDNTLYVLAQELLNPTRNVILYTTDLQTWDVLVESDEWLISLEYWPYKDWLIIGSAGRNAKILYFDLSPTLSSIQLSDFDIVHVASHSFVMIILALATLVLSWAFVARKP